MGKNSKIEWCDHTFNPWIGCTKVSPGCENCYAEAQNKRFNWNSEGWGKGVPRKRTSEANWKKPLKWNNEARDNGTRPRVFCGSLCDVFDKEVSRDWRWELFELIKNTPYLDWLLLTKRPLEAKLWNTVHGWSYNVWLGATVENQAMANERIPILLDIPLEAVRFLSVEPMLEPIILVGKHFMNSIDWVICGGESGSKRRHFDLNWARYMRDQCKFTGTPFFFKQVDKVQPIPDDLMIREFPE